MAIPRTQRANGIWADGCPAQSLLSAYLQCKTCEIVAIPANSTPTRQRSALPAPLHPIAGLATPSQLAQNP